MDSRLGVCIHGVGTEYVEKNDIKRVQVCHKFSETEKMTSLLKLKKKRDIEISYHAPVFHQVDPKSTYYLSKNFRMREATFEILEINLRMAKTLKSAYTVIHFTSDTMKSEAYESGDEIGKISRRSAKRLNMLAQKYDMDINLEYASYANIFRDVSDWIEIVRDYDRLGICLDIGQLYRNCIIDGFDLYQKLEEILPYTRVVHIWNMKDLGDLERYGYIPVHPSQDPKEGWMDIRRIVDMLKSEDREIPIIFEPNFEYNGEKYFTEGINWVNSMVEEVAANKSLDKSLDLEVLGEVNI